ncbi:hypothetical protein, partial [Cohnella sp. 56]|uniref:hypothetical protein n=1 Tax=Cohnella sp. 56 TaxID=3113722 RepID=UPI0030EABF44
WENSLCDGVIPQCAVRSPGYRHLKSAIQKGQPEILADLIIRNVQVFDSPVRQRNLKPANVQVFDSPVRRRILKPADVQACDSPFASAS